MNFRSLLLFLCAVLCAGRLFGQSPRNAWRTIETPDFRLHYPVPFEAWAERAAARLESARSIVSRDVGFVPAGKTDVVIEDPIAQANGSAWPFLGFPRMILWTSPPGAASPLANYGDWTGLLIVHEETHLVHLLRPSRNPARNALAHLSPVPLGPITPAPRWISEGYATLVEGELTGYGRPNSEFRAAVLRQWALEGRLPTYAQLGSDSSNWLGMSMAYLGGSSFLEWLRDRTGEDSLRHLWARMTARQGRSFDASFEGVFGDTPRAMYARFAAETTRDAFAAEQMLKGTLQEGTLWQGTRWTTDPPVLSPDGKLLATVLRDRTKPPRLVVYSTDAPTDEEKRWRERIEKILRRDPEDVAPVLSKPLPRKPVHELPSVNGLSPSAPRWIDGESILFTQFEPDREGFLHPDLYVWSVKKGGLHRVTYLSDVRNADALRDGSAAFAIRNRNGFSQVVKVALSTGVVSDVTPPSVDITYDTPRVSEDGRLLAYVRNAETHWGLVIRDLVTGAEHNVELPQATSIVSFPSFAPDGKSVYATLAAAGAIEIWQLSLDGASAPRQITRGTGASMASDASNDSLYFLSLTPDGFAIRRLALPAGSDLPSLTLPIVHRGTEQLVPASAAATPRPYVPRLEPAVLAGGTYGPQQRFIEATARFGDLVGRLDTTVTGSYGNAHALRGVSAAARWRGLPFDVVGQVYRANDQRDEFEVDRTGGELRADWSIVGRPWGVALAGGLLDERLGKSLSGNRSIGSIALSGAYRPSIGSLSFPTEAEALVQRGTTADDSWTRSRWRVEAGAAVRRNSIQLSYERGQLDGSGAASREAFQLGGDQTALLPAFALEDTVMIPYLPPSTLSGSRFDRSRITLTPGTLFTFFFDRVGAGSRDGDWTHIRSGGLELTYDLTAMPVVKLPNASIRAGVARIFDGELANRNEAWLGLHWRP